MSNCLHVYRDQDTLNKVNMQTPENENFCTNTKERYCGKTEQLINFLESDKNESSLS